MVTPTAFAVALRRRLAEAERRGLEEVTVRASEQVAENGLTVALR